MIPPLPEWFLWLVSILDGGVKVRAFVVARMVRAFATGRRRTMGDQL